jgi:flavin-dependent dehydrogenase
MSRTVIVGGGLAGAFVAAKLAAAGERPLLLERSLGPHDKVCGEFLSAEAQRYLASVGLEPERLGAHAITHVRIASGARVAEARLPFRALGVSRRALDETLLDQARRLGAAVERGVVVRSLDEAEVETSVGILPAERIVLASGKHDVRGAQRLSASADWGMIGFKTYLELDRTQQRALSGRVEIVVFDGGYAGLQMVEDDLANLCLLVRKTAFAEAGGQWPNLFARLLEEPHLARRLGGATARRERPLAIAGLPFGFVRRVEPRNSIYPVGDQAAVIASFTGDGMSIALHSASLAAQAIIENAPPRRYLSRLHKDVGRPIGLAGLLQRRLEGWPGPAACAAVLAAFPQTLTHLARLTRLPSPAYRGLVPARAGGVG